MDNPVLTPAALSDFMVGRIRSLLNPSEPSGDHIALARDLATRIMGSQVIYVTDNGEDVPATDRAFILFDQDREGHLMAQSIKPSNVTFNLGNLLRALASGALSVAGASTEPVLCVTAVLLMIGDLKNAVAISLGDPHAYVLKAVWDLRYSRPDDAAILERTNSLLSDGGLAVLSPGRLRACLRTLADYRCVESSEDGGWAVVEAVQVGGRKE